MLKIALVSTSGGVGRTTLTANLATALAQRGSPVLALDLDPQNLLALHLGMPPGRGEGLAASVLAGQAWQESGQRNSDGVRFLPYGQLDRAHEFRFMQKLADAGDGWLRTRLGELGLPAETITLIDTPRLPSIHAQQALAAADLVLGILNAEISTYASLRALLDSTAAMRDRCYFVLNQVDATRALQNDIMTVLRNDLGAALSGQVIHRDVAVAEATASNSAVTVHAPHSQAAHDFQGQAGWLLSLVRSDGAWRNRDRDRQ
ncbi:MAG TPA: cellulose biosynthesis protein BcsQ [Stenotrophobium sp.]|jgi:cellulose synthase operon protein YhjQ|nr:cellulose biosynthesis protein BcsQ [Stenotrophobium sp.]